MISLSELEEFIERRLPFGLQESWDRSGVWFRNNRGVERIGVSLELTELYGMKVDTAIVHHPPVLSSEAALKNDKVLKAATELNLIVCHTNADKARDSFVDAIVEDAGIEEARPLVPACISRLKVVTFIDGRSRGELIDEIQRRGVSSIGFYDSCTFSAAGRGTFKPVAQAQPFTDSPVGELDEVEEWRIEFETDESNLNRIIEMVMEVHPYDEPVVEVYRFSRYPKGAGTGRIGTFSGDLGDLCDRLKKIFPSTRVLNKCSQEVSPVCIVPGGGRKLLPYAAARGARTFISGDLDYHALLDAKEKKLNIISISHEEAEKYFVAWMKEILEQQFNDKIEILVPGE